MNDFPSFFVILSGKNFIPLLSCFWYQLIPLYGMLGMFEFTAVIALDRVFLLLFPLCHRKLKVKWYIISISTICFIYTTWLVSKSYAFSARHPDWPAVCTMEDTFMNEIGELYSYQGIALYAIAVVLYVIIVFGFMCSVCQRTGYDGQDRRLMKSLSVIFFIIIFVYILNLCIRMFILPLLHLDPITYRLTTIILGLPVNIEVAANPVVLYIFSTEYRLAIQNFCNSVFATFGLQQRIKVQSTLVNPSI
ncbi:serpentine type 7TM GPCR chemoreceptor srsx domain-containing protein [Ditylenchus destructor]|nr:serpentine type 7TM GPCR chemoreceptor srsx domain-containing protein [Ditylenchus destructor]